MKINEVEAAVGVTKKNIRFYEEEGLLSPQREAGNGYRTYSEADVERLRRIKLLRKLDVPLAEIRTMLDGDCTLAEGMARHTAVLEGRRADLEEALDFCRVLREEQTPLAELDVNHVLQRLTEREAKGVTFVDIEKTDRRAERYQGACIGAGIFIALMAFVIAMLVWAFLADPENAPPLPLMLVLGAIPVGCIIGTLVVLADRIKQIGKGEEDAYRNY
jgi:DNA-binding transcriptional MerR regulator